MGTTGMRLQGKVALISGGSRGMGAAHARAMVAEGASVVIADVLDDEGAALADELGDRAAYVHLDVTDRGQWTAAVQAATGRFGALHVLVNNAGIANFGPIGAFPPEEWDRVIAINLTGVFNGIHASVEALMASAPASIINISSTAGMKGYPMLPGYTAAKWGVRGLTKSVALDLGPFGVRCNSVHPGVIDTPMTAGMQASPLVALGRMGRPDEVANLVVFLASDESSYCTGAEFVIDGGDVAGNRMPPGVIPGSAG